MEEYWTPEALEDLADRRYQALDEGDTGETAWAAIVALAVLSRQVERAASALDRIAAVMEGKRT